MTSVLLRYLNVWNRSYYSCEMPDVFPKIGYVLDTPLTQVFICFEFLAIVLFQQRLELVHTA